MRPYSKRTVVGWPFGSTRVSSRALREETSREVVELTRRRLRAGIGAERAVGAARDARGVGGHEPVVIGRVPRQARIAALTATGSVPSGAVFSGVVSP